MFKALLTVRMMGRGKLMAVMGDEDTMTGFLLDGIGVLNKNCHPNFLVMDFLGRSDGKSICLQCRRPRFSPWVGKISWRRK